MKALLTGKNAQNITSLVKKLGFEMVASDPDIIISYGGDGTLLASERLYPGIAKLPIRNSKICNKCLNHADETVLKKLLTGKLPLKEYRKLETNINGQTYLALNDFVIRNTEPVHTIRFKVFKNNTPINGILIGDGIVAATPFGSTGYFKSITNESFNHGFGLAFNNITERKNPVIFSDKDTAEFNLIRGKATLTFDNNLKITNLREGTKLVFNLSGQAAKIYQDTSLRCPNCKIQR